MNEKEDVDGGLALAKSIPFDHKVYAEMYKKNMVKEAKSIIERFDIDGSKKDQIKNNNNYYVPYSLEKTSTASFKMSYSFLACCYRD